MRLPESSQEILGLYNFCLHQLIAKSCKYIADGDPLAIKRLKITSDDITCVLELKLYLRTRVIAELLLQSSE
jgi:hypothetical protein